MNEIYHDESLGIHINVVLVRMIMLGYSKVRLVMTVTLIRGLLMHLAGIKIKCIGILCNRGLKCFKDTNHKHFNIITVHNNNTF